MQQIKFNDLFLFMQFNILYRDKNVLYSVYIIKIYKNTYIKIFCKVHNIYTYMYTCVLYILQNIFVSQKLYRKSFIS